MAKSLISLTLGEAHSPQSLSLEQKDTTTTWAKTGTEDWGGASRDWTQPGEFSTRETKTSVSLTLE